jgi:Cu(I)/Ag(I) efflux system membrane fusion protein
MRGEGAMYVIAAVRPEGDGHAPGGGGDAEPMPAEAETADAGEAGPPPILVAGFVNGVDAQARTANISHDDIPEIGMPGMTMDFPLGADLEPDSLPVGTRVLVGLRRSGGMQFVVESVEPVAEGPGR